MDIEAGGNPLGRLLFELRDDIVPKTVEIFGRCVLAKKGLDTKGRASIASFPNLCAKGAISRGATVVAEKAFLATSLRTKIFSSSTSNRAPFPWPTPVPTPTDPSSSFAR